MKTCPKCGKSKPTSEFGKHASKHDGLQPYCKPCKSIMWAAWLAKNKDKKTADSAAYRVANKDKIREYSAKWRKENPEKQRAASAKWAAENQENIRARNAEWAAANPERKRSNVAKWAAENPEARRIHHQNRRARKRDAGGKLSTGLAVRLFRLQRGKCACGCGKPLGDDFHLDHRMPLALGGVNEDWNIQLLRATCNQQKHAKHPVDFMQQRGFLL